LERTWEDSFKRKRSGGGLDHGDLADLINCGVNGDLRIERGLLGRSGNMHVRMGELGIRS
jgi:hypothetical protein